MLIQEAEWFAARLAELGDEVFPLCNVGSSTLQFRTAEQPWIDGLLFGPPTRRGAVVRHVDMKAAPGVDLVGDLCNAEFRRTISRMHFNSVFCSNLLEHVRERTPICRALVDIVVPGGYLFVSVPYRYPYHPDPIDTEFRPSRDELAAQFHGTRVVEHATVNGGSFLSTRKRSPMVLALTFLRPFVPMYKPAIWWKNRGYVPWFFRQVSATCLVLRKIAQ